jgi:hypothetical protein
MNYMPMKAIKFLFVVVSGILSIAACTDDGSEAISTDPNDSSDVALTDVQANFLATLADTVIQLKDIYFDDGQSVLTFLKNNDPGFLEDYPYGRAGRTKALTPFQQKQLFFSRMYVRGYYLADDSEHIHPADGADGPAQTGLAYSWGSKDYNIRQVPPVSSGCMDSRIYGLDCTGMVWAMTQAAQLTVVPKYHFFVQYINDAQKWTDAFKASADYKDLEMKDMGELPPGKIVNGDIIFWNSHIGIFLYGWIYQSNGTANAPGCKQNLLPSRGPRMIRLGEVLNYSLGSYRVFRTIHEHNYTFTIKYRDNLACGYTGQVYTDSAALDVKVKENEVTISNIVNHTPSVLPLTLTIVNDCELTCNPGSTGIFNIVSGSGLVEEAPEELGNYKFDLDIVHSQVGALSSALLACQNAPAIPVSGPPHVNHTDHYTFILADSVQTQGSPPGPYGMFIKLTPK